MSRAVVAWIATGLLLALTLATWWVSESQLGAPALAALALLKVGVVGAVFLELDRAWPLWGVLAAFGTGVVAVGAALLVGG